LTKELNIKDLYAILLLLSFWPQISSAKSTLVLISE